MMEQAFEELLHRSLDGEATSEERVKLQEYLAANPACRAEAEDLEILCRMLAGAGPVDPPEAWKMELLRQLRALAEATSTVAPHSAVQAATRAAPFPPGGLRAAAAALRRHLMPATAYTFVAGAVAGIALVALIEHGWDRSSPLGSDSLPGTMLPAGRLAGGPTLDEKRFDLSDGAVVVSTRLAGGRVVAEIEAQSPGPCRIELQFDPAALVPVAFEQTETGAASTLVEGGQVRIEHRGRNHYRLVLAKKGEGSPPLRVRVQAGDSIRDAVVRTRRDTS